MMSEPAKTRRIEPRWPVAVVIIAAVALLEALPGRIRLFPFWAAYVVGVVILAPMFVVTLTGGKGPWRRIERIIILVFFFVMLAATITGLMNLIDKMLHPTEELTGLQLLTSSIAIWINNVLMFSLLYWQVDRGGPEARTNKAATMPDWLFPQESAPAEDVQRDWRSAFLDYLFLSFSTATAFSTTDTVPLTPRAKLLMMLESAISLATIVIVAARAINILGS